jgi:hypothetical protein
MVLMMWWGVSPEGALMMMWKSVAAQGASGFPYRALNAGQSLELMAWSSLDALVDSFASRLTA